MHRADRTDGQDELEIARKGHVLKFDGSNVHGLDLSARGDMEVRKFESSDGTILVKVGKMGA